MAEVTKFMLDGERAGRIGMMWEGSEVGVELSPTKSGYRVHGMFGWMGARRVSRSADGEWQIAVPGDEDGDAIAIAAAKAFEAQIRAGA